MARAAGAAGAGHGVGVGDVVAALSEHPLWWLYFLFTGVLEMFMGERRQSEVGPSVVWAGAVQATSAVRELVFSCYTMMVRGKCQ